MKRWQWVLWLWCFTFQVFADGRLIEIAATDSTPALNLYLPHAERECAQEGYPILYLFHGIRGNHWVWEEKGRVKEVMDSLIVNNLIEPAIVVMPYCFTKTPETEINRIFTRYDNLCQERFEGRFGAIMRYVETTYSVSQNRYKRAIAGLSSGARQAMNLADTARCGVVGMFSPVLSAKQQPPQDPPFYWIATGDADGFRSESVAFMRLLERRNVPYTMHWLEGRHGWEVWSKALPMFVEAVFPLNNEFLTHLPDPTVASTPVTQ